MKRAVLFAITYSTCSVLYLAIAAAQAPVAGPNPAAPATGAPFPQLSAEEQKFLDEVLAYWERRSQGIERYRCVFRRWEYDPVFGPRNTFKVYSEGSIMYASPDKGKFQVEKMMQYAAPPNRVNRRRTWRKIRRRWTSGSVTGNPYSNTTSRINA